MKIKHKRFSKNLSLTSLKNKIASTLMINVTYSLWHNVISEAMLSTHCYSNITYPLWHNVISWTMSPTHFDIMWLPGQCYLPTVTATSPTHCDIMWFPGQCHLPFVTSCDCLVQHHLHVVTSYVCIVQHHLPFFINIFY